MWVKCGQNLKCVYTTNATRVIMARNINLSFPPDLVTKIDTMRGLISRSAYIRSLVLAELEKIEVSGPDRPGSDPPTGTLAPVDATKTAHAKSQELERDEPSSGTDDCTAVSNSVD